MYSNIPSMDIKQQRGAIRDKLRGSKTIGAYRWAEDMRAYEYSVLVTSLEDKLLPQIQHYRDRADCENILDEIKNQWGWGWVTTHDQKSCQLMIRIIALVYNC